MKRFIANSPGIGSDLIRPVKDLNRLPQWLPRGKTILTPCARNSIYLGYKAMGLGKDDQILVPAFVCNSVTNPLIKAGARPLYFNVHEDCTVDWAHVKKIMNAKVKAMLWYHFLGTSHGFDKIIPFCKNHGLYLIEDCAHALFTFYHNRLAGSYGDYSVFSIRKSISTLFAAALVIRNKKFSLKKYSVISEINGKYRQLLHEWEGYLYRLHYQSDNSRKEIVRNHYRYYAKNIESFFPKYGVFPRVDNLSLQVMHNINPARVRNRAAGNFRVYLKHLKEIGVLKSMTMGASPIGYAIRIKNRDKFKKRLEKEGIESCIHWPDWLLPRGVYKRFPEAARLADSILTLPCHYDLDKSDIGYICRTVKRLI
jgi:dTDP-4-amino-4,6-dideoxygalactose transaminase